MEDAAEGGGVVDALCGCGELFLGVGADADEELGLEGFDDGAEVGGAGFVDGGDGGGGKFIGGEIGAGVFHPDEGAEIGDEVVGEEVIGLGILLREQSPEAAATDFGAFAIEAADGALGMFGIRFANRSGNAHPVAGCGDFAEGHAGLGHAVGPRIHAEHEDALLALSEAFEIVAVAVPGVVEGVVGAGDGLGEGEGAEGLAEFVGGVDEGGHGGEGALGRPASPEPALGVETMTLGIGRGALKT